MAITGAISALDQALWDIRGKHLGVPVWQLLGGRARRAVRAMRVVDTGSIEQVVEAARRAVSDEGYSALKILLFQDDHHGLRQARRIEDLVARFAAVRETVGWDVDLGVELHRNMTAGDAVLLCAELARLRPLFVEDPIPPDSVAALRAFVARVDVPVAAGERCSTIWEFAEYLERPGVAFVRPDVGIAGGITHVKKICSLAEAFHAGVLPHSFPSGPVAVAAHVQLGACVPNWELQEHVPQDEPRFTGPRRPRRRGARRIPDPAPSDPASASSSTTQASRAIRRSRSISRTRHVEKTDPWRSGDARDGTPPDGRAGLQRAGAAHVHRRRRCRATRRRRRLPPSRLRRRLGPRRSCAARCRRRGRPRPFRRRPRRARRLPRIARS